MERNGRLRRPTLNKTAPGSRGNEIRAKRGASWSGRRASNPLPRPWQGRALPSELLPLGQRSNDTPPRPAEALAVRRQSEGRSVLLVAWNRGDLLLRFEDLLDAAMEGSRQRERKRQARIVFARLDRVDRLPRNSQPLCELCLRPIQLSPQDPQPILHRYRNVKMAVPTPHITAINGSTKVQFR